MRLDKDHLAIAIFMGIGIGASAASILGPLLEHRQYLVYKKDVNNIPYLVIIEDGGEKSVFTQRGNGIYMPLKEATEEDIKRYFKEKFRTYRPPLDSVIERKVDPPYKGLDSIENKL